MLKAQERNKIPFQAPQQPMNRDDSFAEMLYIETQHNQQKQAPPVRFSYHFPAYTLSTGTNATRTTAYANAVVAEAVLYH